MVCNRLGHQTAQAHPYKTPMPITVLSPHSGQPVKIRDADVGRAVRDAGGNVFYVVERPDGAGHYGARTRRGSPQDLAHYDALPESTSSAAPGATASAVRPTPSNATSTPPSPPTPHDARGPGRPTRRLRAVVLLLILLALLVGAYLGYQALHARGLLTAGAPILPSLWNPHPPGATASAVQLKSPTTFAPAYGTTTPDTTPDTTTWQIRRVVNPAAPDLDAADAAARIADRDAIEGFTVGPTGLRVRTDLPATDPNAPRANPGDFVVARYVVRHEQTGLILDETPPDAPLGFVLWSGTVSRGLDEGIAGMRVGEQRTLLIPAALAEGDGAPGGELRAEVELLRVLPGVRREVVQSASTDAPQARPGDTLRLHWDLYLASDAARAVVSTRAFGGPARVTVGRGEVIRGLELGLIGLRVGDVADLRIPAYLAYGSRGAAGGLVPPGAALLCRVEVVALQAGG